MRVVAKFGGTSLGSDDRINCVADSIAAAVKHGHEIAVVTSAMGSTTDDLLDEIEFKADDRGCTEIALMGEWASVRTLKVVLATRDVDALFVEPGTSEWPVITNDPGEVDVEMTRGRAAKPAAEFNDAVPIITDFLAQNHNGEITTLGRGGSGTSAVVFGSYMGVDEVVIVTNVEGVITGNPHVVEGAHNVGCTTVGELRSLSLRGAEAVMPPVLPYKDTALDIRVIHYQHGGLLTDGMPIKGESHDPIDMQEEPLVCLMMAGRTIRNRPGILTDLSAALREGDTNVDSIVSGVNSITFYILEDDSDQAEAVPCDRVVVDDALSSATVESDIAVVRVTSGELPNRPGVILDIIKPLFGASINIHDAITSATSAAIFVAWDDCEETLGIIQSEFRAGSCRALGAVSRVLAPSEVTSLDRWPSAVAEVGS